MTYSTDFRNHILSIKSKEKLSFRQTAKRFGVSPNTLLLWEKGMLPKNKRSKRPVKIQDDWLLNDLKESPDDFQYERAQRLNVSASGIGAALKRLNVTRKKTLFVTQKLAKKNERTLKPE